MAIRRGVVGGWPHTLVCGVGSVLGDLALFSLALLGGSYLLPWLTSQRLQIVLMAVGAMVLFPAGVHFLTLAARNHRQAHHHACHRFSQRPVHARLASEVARATTFTVVNPMATLYWVGVTSSWLPSGYAVLGRSAPWWGTAMAGMGILAWFTILALIVRFLPDRNGVFFFRMANAVLGLILFGFAGYCAVNLAGHLLRVI